MIRFTVFLLCLLVIAAGCHKDSSNPVDGENNKPTVTTTIAGVVSDESGKGIGSITVVAHGRTSITNEHGLFIIKDVRVPEDRCFVLARKDGFFTASRAEIPKAGGITHMQLGMMRNAANYAVQASSGGIVTLAEGGSVQLPANGFITESGAPYTGTVKVAARWLNPVSPDFFQFFPGDFTARRTNGSDTFLYSYGVLNIELYTESGAKLNLAPGKKAMLKFPIPAGMQGDAPVEMPLWYMDETIGMWKEEGKAVKQGNQFVGEVAHFTSWNCDVPASTAMIKGYVKDQNNEPQSNIFIQVGERQIVSDQNGYFETKVPADIAFQINVDETKNMGSGTPTPIPAGPFTAGHEETIGIIINTPARISGKLVDCNTLPVNGFVEAISPSGYRYTYTNNGTFILPVEANTDVEVRSIGDNNVIGEPVHESGIPQGITKDIGVIPLCNGGQPTVTDFELDDLSFSYNGWGSHSIALSFDKTRIVVANDNYVYVFDTGSKTLLRKLEIPTSVRDYPIGQYVDISRDNSKCLLARGTVLLENEAFIWDISTGQLLLTLPFSRAIFTADSKEVIGQNINQILPVYSIATGERVKNFYLPDRPDGMLMGAHPVDIIGNGTTVALHLSYSLGHGTSTGYSEKAVLLNLETGDIVEACFLDVWTFITDLQISADGTVVGACTHGFPILHFFENGLPLQAPGLETDKHPYLLSPDGRSFIFQKSSDQPVGLYAVNGLNLIRHLGLPSKGSQFISYDYGADGKSVAGLWTTSTSAGIRIWQL